MLGIIKYIAKNNYYKNNNSKMVSILNDKGKLTNNIKMIKHIMYFYGFS